MPEVRSLSESPSDFKKLVRFEAMAPDPKIQEPVRALLESPITRSTAYIEREKYKPYIKAVSSLAQVLIQENRKPVESTKKTALSIFSGGDSRAVEQIKQIIGAENRGYGTGTIMDHIGEHSFGPKERIKEAITPHADDVVYAFELPEQGVRGGMKLHGNEIIIAYTRDHEDHLSSPSFNIIILPKGEVADPQHRVQGLFTPQQEGDVIAFRANLQAGSTTIDYPTIWNRDTRRVDLQVDSLQEIQQIMLGLAKDRYVPTRLEKIMSDHGREVFRDLTKLNNAIVDVRAKKADVDVLHTSATGSVTSIQRITSLLESALSQADGMTGQKRKERLAEIQRGFLPQIETEYYGQAGELTGCRFFDPFEDHDPRFGKFEDVSIANLPEDIRPQFRQAVTQYEQAYNRFSQM
ncbi:hypothetical protein C4564_01580 [Candidatus Microgenomates bacterium]|nr:MAG: hypothetical protein C4564_01580 [Candidatus Microgenomates bacterium]